MACEYIRQKQQTPEQRAVEVADALRKLEQAVRSGQVKLTVGQTGAVALSNWQDRRGISDACAVRLLSSQSFQFRCAVMRAEAQAGRKVNLQAQVHSHDGGQTWHPNH